MLLRDKSHSVTDVFFGGTGHGESPDTSSGKRTIATAGATRWFDELMILPSRIAAEGQRRTLENPKR